MKYDNIKPFSGLICEDKKDKTGCGYVDLTLQQHMDQINNPFPFWRCPICSERAVFNTERFEELHET